MIRKSSSPNPSLRDLAIDAIGDIAAEMQRVDPQLSDAHAVAKAAQTPEGRSAYAMSQRPGAEKPWLQALALFASGDRRVQAKKSAADLLKVRPTAPTKGTLPTGTAAGVQTADIISGSRRSPDPSPGQTARSAQRADGSRTSFTQAKARSCGATSSLPSITRPAEAVNSSYSTRHRSPFRIGN
jgi:hypothetical protein